MSTQLFFPEGSEVIPLPCLSQVLGVAHGPFLPPLSQQPMFHLCAHLPLVPSPSVSSSTFRDSCDYISPSWTVLESLPVSGLAG